MAFVAVEKMNGTSVVNQKDVRLASYDGWSVVITLPKAALSIVGHVVSVLRGEGDDQGWVLLQAARDPLSGYRVSKPGQLRIRSEALGIPRGEEIPIRKIPHWVDEGRIYIDIRPIIGGRSTVRDAAKNSPQYVTA